MQIAIFSDVHGNLTALDAILADIQRQNPDLVVFAGDLCVFGPRPAACVQRLRAEDIPGVYGNTDGWISNNPILSREIEEAKKEREETADTPRSWTSAQLDEMERAWLSSLHFLKRVSPTIYPQDDLLIVHANPVDVDQPIHPPLSVQEELYGEVEQPDDDLEGLLGDLMLDVLCFGHVHIPNVRQWKGLTLANISSVSLPLDGDVRAKYGLLTWDGGWTVEHRRVDYDVEEEVAIMESVQPPKWREHVQRLRTGRAE